MSKQDVLAARGDVFEALLRQARADEAVKQAVSALERARAEYSESSKALSALRSTTDALEANTVAEVIAAEQPKAAMPADMAAAIDEVTR